MDTPKSSDNPPSDSKSTQRHYLTESEMKAIYDDVAGVWSNFKTKTPGGNEEMNELINSLLDPE